MRIGINPNKGSAITKEISEVTLGILVNIPNEAGYYGNAVEVLRECIVSAKGNTDIDFDLLVVDNNSSREVKDLLNSYQEQGLIRFLIFNESNVGRPNGVRQILDFGPGKYVGYADCDIYFKEKWLEKEIELLRDIPNAGFVSGMPNRSFTNYFTEYTKQYIFENNMFEVETGKLVAEEYINAFAESLGYEDISEPINIWNKQDEIRFKYNGITGYIGASHMQFLTKKELIKKLPEIRFEKLFGCNDEIIDRYVDEFGYLRLSTEFPVIHHMGNTPMTSMNLKKKPSIERVSSGSFLQRIYRRVIAKMYDWSFKKYYKIR